MTPPGRTAEGRDLLEYVRRVYGPELNIGMETVFNNLDAARTFHREAKIDRGRRAAWPEKRIRAFETAVPRLLGQTVKEGACPRHDALAERLRVTDTILSLNYDCVIDQSLGAMAGARFSPARGGYGVRVGSGADEWRGKARGRQPAGSIRLLKLHGSLNWARPVLPLPLRPRDKIYDPVAPGVLQAPLTNKPIRDQPFRGIWRSARSAVRRTRRLIMIGYSMPDADGLVRTLLTTDMPDRLDEVIVVDRADAVQSRHVDLFTRRARTGKVFTFSSLEAFSKVLTS